jgi:hypothetical protein
MKHVMTPLLGAAHGRSIRLTDLVLDLPSRYVGDLFELLPELSCVTSVQVPDWFSQRRRFRLKGPQRADRPASGAHRINA